VNTLKFKLTIAYDGTHYAGWQVQKTGLAVQQKVEEAFAKLFPSVQRIYSSSRTDTGVHAIGMVAHVEIPEAEFKMPVRKLALALNAFLPLDIRILSAKRAPADFHARFHAKGKQYRGEAVCRKTRFQIIRREPKLRNGIDGSHGDAM
jgi:tRNA pseudouridine38-40 synthase